MSGDGAYATPRGNMSNEAEAFWSWFAASASRLARRARHDAAGVADEVDTELRRLEVPLRPEIGVHPKGGPIELVLHADGDRAFFELAREYVRAAPVLSDWEYTALRPGHGFPVKFAYEGFLLDPKQMWFLPLEVHGSPTWLGLRVGVADFVPELEDRIWRGCMVLLSAALGEASAVEDVEHVDVVQLPAAPDQEGYIELVELPAFIAWRIRKSKSVS